MTEGYNMDYQYKEDTQRNYRGKYYRLPLKGINTGRLQRATTYDNIRRKKQRNIIKCNSTEYYEQEDTDKRW